MKKAKMEDNISKNAVQTNEIIKKKGSAKDKKKAETQPVVPRGIPKSGRIWKTQKTKFSSMVKTRGIRDKFAKKEALREELKRVKEASKAILAAKKDKVEQKKQRRRDNLKRQEENRKKSEIVQVIKNPSKIKRMKKKQLRMIEKRDTTNM